MQIDEPVWKQLEALKKKVLADEDVTRTDYVKVLDNLQGKAPEGECEYCDDQRLLDIGFHPPHNASPRCESGGKNHCSCDICF